MSLSRFAQRSLSLVLCGGFSPPHCVCQVLFLRVDFPAWTFITPCVGATSSVKHFTASSKLLNVTPRLSDSLPLCHGLLSLFSQADSFCPCFGLLLVVFVSTRFCPFIPLSHFMYMSKRIGRSKNTDKEPQGQAHIDKANIDKQTSVDRVGSRKAKTPKHRQRN